MEQDSKIDNAELSSESLKIPYLHGKWYRMFCEEMQVMHLLKSEMAVLKKEKHEYYSGRAHDEVYAENPLDMKVLKQDMDIYINADPEYQRLSMKLNTQQLKLDTIESFLKNINQRTFVIKNAIDFLKFRSGEN